MKKLLIWTTAIFTLFTSCETDVDITADWENIPIVYCVLDTADAVHYVRIQRAFLGNQNAYFMALHGDSLIYHETLDVRLHVFDNQNRKVNAFTFQKFNLDKDSLNQQGLAIFGRTGHHVYRLQQKLPHAEGYSYQLEITFPDGKVARSKIKSLERFRHRDPAIGTKYTLKPNMSFGPRFWAPSNAGAVKVIMHFHYYEFTNPNVYERKTISIAMKPVSVKPDSENGVSLKTNDIIKRFIEEIPIAEPGVYRFLGKVDFEYYVADNTFADQLFKRNAGISGETNPISNIEGAYGIFAWRLYKRFNGWKSSIDSRNSFNDIDELRLRGFPRAIKYNEEGYKIDDLP